jgi:hypothetical protein
MGQEASCNTYNCHNCQPLVESVKIGAGCAPPQEGVVPAYEYPDMKPMPEVKIKVFANKENCGPPPSHKENANSQRQTLVIKQQPLSMHAKEQVLVNALSLAVNYIYEDPLIPQEYPGKEVEIEQRCTEQKNFTEQELHEQERELQRWLAEQERGWCNEKPCCNDGEGDDLEHQQHGELEYHDELVFQHEDKEQFTMQKDAVVEKGDAKDLILMEEGEPRKCEVIFSGSKGKHPETVPIVFMRRPLGIEFDRPFVSTAKVRVKCVKKLSHGAELGVQKGWLLTEVEGKDVTQLSFDKAMAVLNDLVVTLPEVQYLK